MLVGYKKVEVLIFFKTGYSYMTRLLSGSICYPLLADRITRPDKLMLLLKYVQEWVNGILGRVLSMKKQPFASRT